MASSICLANKTKWRISAVRQRHSIYKKQCLHLCTCTAARTFKLWRVKKWLL